MFVGANGAGKTNLLEALSLLAPGRGLRGVKSDEIALNGSPTAPTNPLRWAAAVTLLNDVHLSTGLELTPHGTEKRLYKIQHEPVKSQAAIAEWLTVFWLTPETDRLFLESPSVRRKFIDRLVYANDPLHATRLTRYDHALKERLQVLRQGGDPIWLTSLEENLANYGVAIAAARLELMKKLNRGQDHLHPLFPRFVSSINGDVENWLLADYAVTVESQIKEKLHQNRMIDRESGMTRLGPHRSDWNLVHLKNNRSANQCSTGEQKILILAALLSFLHDHSKNGDTQNREKLTVLLLDDVVAHLDFHHRMVLFEQIGILQNNRKEDTHEDPRGSSVHTWLTGTDPLLFEHLTGHAQFFNVHQSTVTLS